MCGIIGYTGRENAVPKLLEGLLALEYRGYDSAGIAVFEGADLRVIKSKGRLSILDNKIKSQGVPLVSHCGIGHTRWATHGEPSDVNSHPHGTPRVSIVHNGIIENYAQIKQFLIDSGYRFESQTDTETAAKLIDYFYALSGDPVYSLRRASEKFSGSYAIGAVFSRHPGVIYAVRKDNPLIIAISENGNFIASDMPAVLKHTNRFYRLEEGELAVVGQNIIIYDKNGNISEKQPETADWDMEAAEKGGYPHFMIKEIHEEPEAVLKTLRPRIKDGMPDFGIPKLCDESLSGIDRIHMVACGTAMHAALIGKYAVEQLARVPVDVEIGSEFRYKNPIIGENDMVIVISQSGETADTLAALRLAKSKGVYTLAVVNAPGSTIAREADGVIYTWAGPEIAVASTKAYTVQISILYLFAIRLAYAKGAIDEVSARGYVKTLISDAPESIKAALAMEKKCADIAMKYKDSKDVFFIGRGIDNALCAEASLKMKEVSYIHCEAYAAGELKHGTISLVTQGVPVFAFANTKSMFEKTVSNIKEVRARGAKIILLCPDGFEVPSGVADEILRVPAISELFIALPSATLFQLIAYYSALYLGCDVDKPRNLAKSVTVE